MKQQPSFATASRYVFWGFLLSFFYLDVWYLKTIQIILAFAFLFQGLSMLRRVNPALHKAWIVSCCHLIINLIGLVLAATPAQIYQIPLVIANFILWILLVLWYFSGIEALGIAMNGVKIPQCHRIIVEYIAVNVSLLFILLVPMLALPAVMIMFVINIIILVQITRAHRQIDANGVVEKTTAGYLPSIAIVGGYFCITVGLILGISYYFGTKEDIRYQVWDMSLAQERAALQEAHLPEDVVKSLSDEDVLALGDVDKFVGSVDAVRGYYVSQYVGVSKDHKQLHYLASYVIQDAMTKGHCSITAGIQQSTYRFGLVNEKLVTLYDNEGKTYGYEDHNRYEFTLNKGENRRGYYYAAYYHEGGNLGVFEPGMSFVYDKSWLRYPYDAYGLLNETEQGDFMLSSSNMNYVTNRFYVPASLYLSEFK